MPSRILADRVGQLVPVSVCSPSSSRIGLVNWQGSVRPTCAIYPARGVLVSWRPLVGSGLTISSTPGVPVTRQRRAHGLSTVLHRLIQLIPAAQLGLASSTARALASRLCKDAHPSRRPPRSTTTDTRGGGGRPARGKQNRLRAYLQLNSQFCFLWPAQGPRGAQPSVRLVPPRTPTPGATTTPSSFPGLPPRGARWRPVCVYNLSSRPLRPRCSVQSWHGPTRGPCPTKCKTSSGVSWRLKAASGAPSLATSRHDGFAPPLCPSSRRTRPPRLPSTAASRNTARRPNTPRRPRRNPQSSIRLLLSPKAPSPEHRLGPPPCRGSSRRSLLLWPTRWHLSLRTAAASPGVPRRRNGHPLTSSRTLHRTRGWPGHAEARSSRQPARRKTSPQGR